MTVSIPAKSSWGDNCTLAQIHKQASEEAFRTINGILHGSGVSIIDTPKVKSIVSEKGD